MDIAVLQRLSLPGVKLPQQERSRAVMAGLMRQALAMLRDRSFDGLSIDELCKAQGCTVGSFYARFASKEAFLHAVQHLVVAEASDRLRARMTPERFARVSLEEMLAGIVRRSLQWFALHEGLIRGSLRAAPDGPIEWSPLRELGRLNVETATPILLGKMRRQGPEEEARIRVAFQMLFGTLNNMILINPGPLTIHNPRSSELLTGAMAKLLAD